VQAIALAGWGGVGEDTRAAHGSDEISSVVKYSSQTLGGDIFSYNHSVIQQATLTFCCAGNDNFILIWFWKPGDPRCHPWGIYLDEPRAPAGTIARGLIWWTQWPNGQVVGSPRTLAPS